MVRDEEDEVKEKYEEMTNNTHLDTSLSTNIYFVTIQQ